MYCVRVGDLVEVEWLHIFYTEYVHMPLFEYFVWGHWEPCMGRAVVAKTKKIVSFATCKTSVLVVHVKRVQTWLAYMCIILANMVDERVFNGVRRVVVIDEYCRKQVFGILKGIGGLIKF